MVFNNTKTSFKIKVQFGLSFFLEHNIKYMGVDMFEIIDGGTDLTPELKKKQDNHKFEQLKVFVAHMRTLENSISTIQTMAGKIKWHELDSRLVSCHNQILDTLSFVKNSSNMKKIEAKKKPTKNHLKLI